MSEKETKEFRFGNKTFGGRIKPGELELNFPDELSRDEFENMFMERLESLHKIGREIIPFDEEISAKKEKLKPLSIRVKDHTKQFFKESSILSAREVLELYENFNHGSEAFINSLLKDEKNLEKELAEIQEKLHNAELFKDKLNDLDLEETITDEEMIASLEEEYKDSQVKVLFEDSSDKVLGDIQLYNTQKVVLDDTHLEIVAVNDVIPIVYYFSTELAEDELIKTLSEIKSYSEDNDIEFVDGIEDEKEAEEEDKSETQKESEDGDE